MIYRNYLKRAFDVAASGTMVAATTPIIAPLALVNAALLRENPFITVERVGKNGKPFNMIKLRSMRTVFDGKGQLLPDEQRRTRFGHFLRKTGLDEVPQLINIFKGDMSLVGPRPHDPEEDNDYVPGVRPGITGPWQVAVIGSRTKSSMEYRIAMDESYETDGISFLKDMNYLLLTVSAFYKGHDGETWRRKP